MRDVDPRVRQCGTSQLSCFAEISQWFMTCDLMVTRQIESTRALTACISLTMEKVTIDLGRLDLTACGDILRTRGRVRLVKLVKLVTKLASSNQMMDQL